MSCNSNEIKNTTSSQEIPDYDIPYPHIIDSLKLRDLYDSAIWFIYTCNCDGKYLPKSDSAKTISFGTLPLRFEDLIIKNDTLELHFNFLDKNEIILPTMTRDFRQLLTGVGFNIKEKKKIYMWSPSGYSLVQKGGVNRFENPL